MKQIPKSGSELKSYLKNPTLRIHLMKNNCVPETYYHHIKATK